MVCRAIVKNTKFKNSNFFNYHFYAFSLNYINKSEWKQPEYLANLQVEKKIIFCNSYLQTK
jgi:hypothetical protein